MPEVVHKSEGQRGAEAEVERFRQELGPFVIAAEKTRMPMVFTDAKEPNHPIVFANDSFLALTGFSREEVMGQDFTFLMAPVEDASAQVETAFAENSNGDLEVRCHRRNGEMFWTAVFISPVRDDQDKIIQHFASFVDLTRHRQEEDRLRFLLDELNHRTQNTLATVQAIVSQTLRGVAADELVDTLQGRILALSKAHGLLGRETWTAIGLREVIDVILQPFGLGDSAPVRVEGEDVRLKPKAALTLAMVFHELATNAAKHGAFSKGAAGKVDIAWRLEPTPTGERMRLQWRESGGPPVTASARKGFGSRLIEGGLAQDLGGEVSMDYAPSGLVCRIDMPMPPVTAG